MPDAIREESAELNPSSKASGFEYIGRPSEELKVDYARNYRGEPDEEEKEIVVNIVNPVSPRMEPRAEVQPQREPMRSTQ